MYHYRVRLKRSEIKAALAHLEENATAGYHATLMGNDPAVECESGLDAAMLIEAFPDGELDYV